MVGKKRSEMMEETRAKLIGAARKAFAEQGYASASMDELTASVGLTRGALYHNFGDKKGLLQAVVNQIDAEISAEARIAAMRLGGGAWDSLIAEGIAYIEMALKPEVQRIVLLDGPAVLGDPSQWPSQNQCLLATTEALEALMEEGMLKPVDAVAAARLLNGAAFNAAIWIAASDNPQEDLKKVVEAFRLLAEGLLKSPPS